MRKIWQYMAEKWYRYVMIFVFMILATLLDMQYPMLLKRLIGDVYKEGHMELLPRLLGGIAVIGLGRAFFGYWKEYTADKTGVQIGAKMRKNLFGHIQGLSMDYFGKTNTGELMARVKDDIDHVWLVVGFIGVLSLEAIFHVCCVLYCMFHLNWKLTIIPIIFMTVCGTVAILLEKKLDQVYDDISEENAELTTIAEENLAGVRTVKSFAREKHEIEKFLSHNQNYFDLNMREAKVMVKYDPIFSFVSVALPMTCAIVGGLLVMQGEMPIEDLLAFVEYSRNCTWPMEILGWLANSCSSAVASQKKIRKIYESKSNISVKENPVVLDAVQGKLAFEHVSFFLENKPILEDVTFEIAPGKTLGIMGATGSGKTMITNLMQRFYDAGEGVVRLDDVDVKDLSLRQIRENISVVMQDVFLFSDTIEENIKMGKKETMSMQHIEKAARKAEAAEFIEELENQYETVIGERGVGLSGGQKQRISIARALSKNSPILILDDSTSALDMETEQKIQKTLKELTGTTKVIIAHRISAVRHADEIIYLKDGKVAERGTHEELLARGGLYYDTYVAQYGDYMPIAE